MQAGLALSRYSASAALLIFMVACILIFKQRPAKQGHWCPDDLPNLYRRRLKSYRRWLEGLYEYDRRGAYQSKKWSRSTS